MNTITLKRGDSVDLLCTLQQGGQPIDLSGWQVDSWLRAPAGQLVHRFAAAVTDAAAGQFRLQAAPQDTARWPLGGLSADIRYVDAAGRVMHTATWPVQVQAAITTP